MHYRDGTEVRVGHRCRFVSGQYADDGKTWMPKVWREGLVLAIDPGPKTCNATVAFTLLQRIGGDGGPLVVRTETTLVTLGECERADVPVT